MATQYVTDSKGDTFIAASQRPDGSWRKPRRVKEGFVPQEEVPLYESKGKKIAKQRAELLPAGITQEAWEKMKQEQQKVVNPQVVSQTSNKKKAAGKKKKSNQNASQNLDQFEINEPVIGNESSLLPSGTNGINTKVTTPVVTKEQKKSKDKLDASQNGSKKSEKVSSAPVEEWVTMGKPKKVSSVQNVVKEVPKNKPAKKVQSNGNANNATPSLIHDPDTDMLIDNEEGDNDGEGSKNAKTTERQQLTKKIKKLKSKFKEAENLKRLSEEGQKLDASQQSKALKVGEFAKEIQSLQNQLQTLKLQA